MHIGGGILTLSGSNSYGGGTGIASGVLALGSSNALPSTTAVSFGGAGTSGTLDLAGFNVQVAGLSVAPGATAANQVIGNSSTASAANLTVNGTSTFAGTIRDTLGGGNQTVSLTVAGGVLTLSGSNTYSGGTNISQGVLAFGANNSIPPGTALSLGSVASGGTLDLAGFNQEIGTLTVAPGAAPAGQVIANSSTTANSTLTVNGVSTFAGTIQNAIGGGNQQVGLTVAGGALTLSGSNTYSGPTQITDGSLILGGNGALPSGTTVSFAGTSGTLDLAGFSPQIAGLSGGTGTRQVVGNSSTTNGAVLTINGVSTFGGTIQNTIGAGSKTLGLTVAGGTLTLTGANTYTGPTNVEAGALYVDGSNAAGSVYTIASGATLGGTGSIASPITLGSGQTLRPATD